VHSPLKNSDSFTLHDRVDLVYEGRRKTELHKFVNFKRRLTYYKLACHVERNTGAFPV